MREGKTVHLWLQREKSQAKEHPKGDQSVEGIGLEVDQSSG